MNRSREEEEETRRTSLEFDRADLTTLFPPHFGAIPKTKTDRDKSRSCHFSFGIVSSIEYRILPFITKDKQESFRG